jgi:NADPH:quinone reductase
MKAVQLHRFGSPDALQLVDLPTPEPGPGQVLVRVHASGINFADTLMRQDRYAITPPLPAVLGSEVAGTIEALGAGVTYTSGARVAAPLFATNSLGGYAEYAVIAADLTALHLVRRSDPAGKVVLVSAAAGGVGSILVQLLRRAGARKVIAAASSAEKLAFAQGLGADLGIDYTQDDWVERLTADLGGSGPDIIYESAGGAVTPACLKVLAPLGQIIVYGALNIQAFALGVPELLSLIFKNQSLTGFAFAPLLDVHSLKKDLGELFELVAAGELKVAIGERYSLENVGEAHRKLEARGTMGKVLLAVGA